ncbi:MAG: aminotransferase class V-fold PLP-dependent enzyme [Myxococcales bacterium]|nr:aminotransferase class V-fold PLP-dependent enzyme [Myxococcales bacterium]
MIDLATPAAPLAAFGLDPEVLHWNHGSWGACPRAALAAQDAVRARIEAATMRFFVVELAPALAAARAAVAAFVGADADGLAFVPNATTAIATALADLELAPGDELVTTSHAYRACKNQLDRLAAQTGARVVVAAVPLPLVDDAAPEAAIRACVGPRTRAVLCDHIASPTAVVFDVAALAATLPPTVALIVDGAHAPGQLPLALATAGATYYAGNLHKWTCAPKGAAFLWVAPARRAHVRPLVISHGASMPTDGTTRFRLEHDWTGSHDPSPYLVAPTAIATVAELGGGWDAVRARGHALALAAAAEVAAALDADPIVAPGLAARRHGAMAALAIALPAGATPLAVERALLARGVEVPIVDHPASPGPLLRLSAHLYSCLADVAPLVAHLRALGVRGRRLA